MVFTDDELRTLEGILIVEKNDLIDLFSKVDEADKKELKHELDNVETIMKKTKFLVDFSRKL